MRKIIVFAAAVISSCLPACGGNNEPQNYVDRVAGDVTVYVTTNTRSQDFNKQAVNFSNEPVSAAATITLNPNQRYQTMDGFGAAVTGSSSYNLLKMTQTNRTKFLKETFSQTEGMGYSYIRLFRLRRWFLIGGEDKSLILDSFGERKIKIEKLIIFCCK